MSGSMRLSAPPASITSASPRATSRNASPTACVPATQAVTMVLFGPWQLNAIEMCAATMFGRYFRSQSGKSGESGRFGSGSLRRVELAAVLARPGEQRGEFAEVHRHQARCPSRRRTAPGRSSARSRPLSATASPAAPTPNRAARPMTLTDLRNCVGDVRLRVEVVDLAGDSDRVVGGVERADRADPAVPVHAPVPECVLPDAVGGDHSHAGDDYPAHDATPIGRAPHCPVGRARHAGDRTAASGRICAPGWSAGYRPDPGH